MASDRRPLPTHDATDEAVATVPVLAESVDVDIEGRTTGRVRVSTRTETIEDRIEETLSSSTVNVVRVPIDRELVDGDPVPKTRVEEGVTIVPVFEERLVVEKRLVLVEELRLEPCTKNERVSAPISLRRQQVSVERTSDVTSSPDIPPTGSNG